MLADLIAEHGAECWLVNTGWSGGAYGTGKRMSIAHTRALVRAALDGRLATVKHAPEPNFGLLVPEGCDGVPSDVLLPKNTWSDKGAYDATAKEVARRFADNFAKFAPHVTEDIRAAAVKTAA